jgi:sugar-specific transcriptional regulator TrmB
MTEANYVQKLQAFDLSLVQAKTYFALLTLEEADIKTIAKNMGVARQEIYRTMPSLEKLGLTQKIIGKPITYKATPLRDTLAILLEKQQEKVAGLLTKQAWLINNFHTEKNLEKNVNEDDAQLTLISEITLFSNLNEKLLAKTQESIDIAIPFVSQRFNRYWLQLTNTITKKTNIKISLILEDKRKQIEMLPRKLLEVPNFKLKYAKDPFQFGVTIFDRKETMIAMSENGLPSLWSNNQNIVSLVNNNFKLMWQRATATKNSGS